MSNPTLLPYTREIEPLRVQFNQSARDRLEEALQQLEVMGESGNFSAEEARGAVDDIIDRLVSSKLLARSGWLRDRLRFPRKGSTLLLWL